ncbi:MAG TPA: hypothetical protein VGG26_08390 [Terracidiphilus sp.]
MSLEATAFIAGNVAEAVVVAMLVYRRAWQKLPFFCIYSLECLIGSLVYSVIEHRFSTRALFNTYFYESILDFALQFCVLVEVAWSVFRPYRKSLPRATVWILGILIAGAGLAIWPFTSAVAPVHSALAAQWRLLVRLQQSASILRILLFVLLAGCSRLLSIGWKDRELQVATGLGFYSLVSLTVTFWHSHQTTAVQYVGLEGLLAASYLCSLLYWAFSFAEKEAERREFSPQMQSVLLAVAGSARATRIALADSGSVQPPERHL